MKKLIHRSQIYQTRFVFQEAGPNGDVDGIADIIRNQAEHLELSEDELHALARRFAELVTSNEAFAAAFQEAIGEIEAAEVETWADTLEAHLRTEAEQYEMLFDLVRDEYPDLPDDPGFAHALENLAINEIDFTPEAQDQALADLREIIEHSQQIEAIIAEYESDIQVPEALLTEDFLTELRTMALQNIDFGQSAEDLEAEVQAFVDSNLVRLRTNNYNREVVGTGDIVDPDNPEGLPTVADTLARIIEEDYEPSERVQGLLDGAQELSDQIDALRAELEGTNGSEAERIRGEIADLEIAAAAALAEAEAERDRERELELSTIAGLMASHTGDFGLDNDGNLIPMTEEAMQEFYANARAAREIPPGTDPDTIESPVTRAIYNQMPPAGTGPEGFQWSNPPTLMDLWRFITALIEGEDPNNPTARTGATPTDRYDNPLPNTVPRGATRAAENSPDHVPNIRLNSEFYGEEMVAEFRELPSSYHEAAAEITSGAAWGQGDIMEDSPEAISGWKLSVMRHAINAQARGLTFNANRPFFANDLATRRALIYYPGGETRETTCVGGSGRDGQGGISNVNNSYGSPLGSFEFRPDTAHRNNSHAYYRAQATVHGIEPMRESFRVHHEQGGNIDPSSGNDNSAGRAILMHGVRDGQGSTWGCWGVPGEVAIEFADAIDAAGGANGEAFVSVS